MATTHQSPNPSTLSKQPQQNSGQEPATDLKAVKKPAAAVTPDVPRTQAKRLSLSSIFGNTQGKVANANVQQQLGVAQQKAVDAFLQKGEDLAAKHEKYEMLAGDIASKIDEQKGRGNKALYELLADVYKLEREIEQSEYVSEIISAMRDALKEKHEINTTDDTPLMTIVIKLVVKTSNRQTASNYSRALRVAKAEGIAPSALADFIAQQGGVSKTLKTAAQKQADAENKEAFKARTQWLRDLMVELAKESGEAFKPVKTEVAILPVATKPTSAEDTERDEGDFTIFIGTRDPDKDQYRIGAGYDLGRPFEEMLLRHIAKRITGDLELEQAVSESVEPVSA